MAAEWTMEEIMDDAKMLFKKLGGTGNKDARIVDRLSRVISAYAFTSILSTEYIIRMSGDIEAL